MLVFRRLGLSEPQPYKVQLRVVKSLISENDEGLHDEKVTQKLGNSVAALYSVPTAIFCFLRAQKPIAGIQTDNPFRRAVQYAVSATSITCINNFLVTVERRLCKRVKIIFQISLGGDTDTIGSMTGAIAGAFYGEEKINSNLLQHLEASEEFRILGDRLFELSVAR